MSNRLIPKFFEGKTKRQAQMKLLLYQVKNQKQGNIVNIYPENGKTVIWFMDEVTSEEYINELKNEKPPEVTKR